MNQLVRYFGGALAAAPLLFLGFIVYVFVSPSTGISGASIRLLALFVGAASLAITAAFIYRVSKRKDWTDGRRMIWIVALLVWPPLTGPVYWYLYELHRRPQSS